MNYGKLTESIYERSVVKVVKTNSDKNRRFYDGTGLGEDCAIFPYDESKKVSLVSGQALAQGRDMDVALRSFIAAVNHVIINTAETKMYANLTIMVPEKLREIKVRQMIERVTIKAEELNIPVLSMNVQVLPSINDTMVSCVVSGMACNDIYSNNKSKPDQDIVMTKWIGLEGTAVIADKYYEKLCGKYHKDIVNEAKEQITNEPTLEPVLPTANPFVVPESLGVVEQTKQALVLCLYQ